MTQKKTAREMGIADLQCADLRHDAGYRGITSRRADLPKTDGSLSRMVEGLVRDTTMSYADIVAAVREQHPHAQTSTKSVASVACVMRKKGIHVPLRLKLNMAA